MNIFQLLYFLFFKSISLKLAISNLLEIEGETFFKSYKIKTCILFLNMCTLNNIYIFLSLQIDFKFVALKKFKKQFPIISLKIIIIIPIVIR